MEIRQRVVLTEQEINQIILDHLRKKGLRIKDNRLQKERGNVIVLTMTEEEIYYEDTLKILKKPLSELSLLDQTLKEKLVALSHADAPIAELLEHKLTEIPTISFRKNNTIKVLFFATSNKNRLTKEDEDVLIKTFNELGIRINALPGLK